MEHVMVDIETLGTTPGSVILTIGAVVFDPVSGAIGNEFYKRIDPVNAQANGLTVDISTVKWWMEQSEEARSEAFGGQSTTPIVLSQLGDFYRNAQSERVWSHGYMDLALLDSVYRKTYIGAPWGFRDIRDTRAVYEMAGVNMRDFADATDTHHNALSDAIVQARAVIAAYRKLGLSSGEVA